MTKRDDERDTKCRKKIVHICGRCHSTTTEMFRRGKYKNVYSGHVNWIHLLHEVHMEEASNPALENQSVRRSSTEVLTLLESLEPTGNVFLVHAAAVLQFLN
jgi:hypothetical protein